MSKEKYGKGYVFRLAVNILLLCEYLYLLYTVLSAFSFIPWYDQLGTSFIHYIFLWIPLCATTLVLVVTMFLTRKVYRPRVILLCFNAIVIPATYFLEAAGTSILLTVLRVLCVVSVISYFIIFVFAVKSRTL